MNVQKAAPTITWANPANIVYGTPLSGTQLDATASVPGTFTYTPAAGTVLGAGNNQSLAVTFTPTDSTDYTGTTGSTTINITVTPLVTVASILLETNKKHQVTQIIVGFSGDLNAAEADQIGTYHLATPGKKGSYTAKNATVIKLKSAPYSAATDEVTLTPKKPFTLTKPVQLMVFGSGPSGLHDSLGRLIDGNDDGQAGGNAVAILAKHGVTIDLATSAKTKASVRKAVKTDLVDFLLERDGLADLIHPLRIREAHRGE